MSIGRIFCGESVQNLFIDEATACVQNIWPGDETIHIVVNGSNILCMKWQTGTIVVYILYETYG